MSKLLRNRWLRWSLFVGALGGLRVPTGLLAATLLLWTWRRRTRIVRSPSPI